MVGADGVEAVAVDHRFARREAEQSWLFVAGLGAGCDAPDLEHGDGGGEGVEGVNGFAVFIEAGGDTKGGVDAVAEEGGGEVGEVGVIAALVEGEPDVVHYGEGAETEGVGGFGAGARDVIAGEEVAECGGDRVRVQRGARVSAFDVASGC